MIIRLRGIPNELCDKLQCEYTSAKKEFQLGRARPSQLDGGRFAEVVLRVFQHLLGTTVTRFGTEIPARVKDQIFNNFANHPSIDLHIRQKVTVLVRLLLDFRNNRDVAHIGVFDVNQIDAHFVLTAVNWVYAELIRVYYGCSLAEAQLYIDAIAIPSYPVIFEIEGEEFITNHLLSARQEALVLICIRNRTEEFLLEKTKEQNKSRFRKMLGLMQKEKTIAWKNGSYHILPAGLEEINSDKLLE